MIPEDAVRPDAVKKTAVGYAESGVRQWMVREGDGRKWKVGNAGGINRMALPIGISDFRLAELCLLLRQHYGMAAVIIIDEYDTPIRQGYLEGHYDDVIAFMRNFLSGGLKDNRNLSMAFLMGILRVAKECIFSGLNNLHVNSILEERYSEYFGFTKAEVQKLLADYGREDKMEEAVKWYDGYRFGTEEIFNPWSVLNYIDADCFPKTF